MKVDSPEEVQFPPILKQVLRRFDWKIFITLGLLALVLATALGLRQYTYWLPHWKGDQSQFVTLTMKLHETGIRGYNLRRAQIRWVNLSEEPPVRLVYPVLLEEGAEGDIVKALKQMGQAYYDEPLHMRAPLFPYTLLLSHRLLADWNQPFMVTISNLNERVKSIRPRVLYESQYWAVIVPLIFSLISMTVVFFFGKLIWSDRVGFYAAFLMATNAVGLMTSQRIWAEELMLSLFTASLLVFYFSYSKQKILGIFIAGILGGLAVLAKQTTALIVVIVGLYTVFTTCPEGSWIRNLYRRLLNRAFLVYALGMILASGLWFWIVFKTYGDPFHQPYSAYTFGEDVSGWFTRLRNRPHPLFLYSFGLVALCPLYSLCLGTFKKLRYEIKEVVSGRMKSSFILLLWIWILVYFVQITEPWLIISGGSAVREHRFFYMAHPAIALAAAYALNQMRLWFNDRFKMRFAGDGVLIVMLVMNACWSSYFGMKSVFDNDVLVEFVKWLPWKA